MAGCSLGCIQSYSIGLRPLGLPIWSRAAIRRMGKTFPASPGLSSVRVQVLNPGHRLCYAVFGAVPNPPVRTRHLQRAFEPGDGLLTVGGSVGDVTQVNVSVTKRPGLERIRSRAHDREYQQSSGGSKGVVSAESLVVTPHRKFLW